MDREVLKAIEKNYKVVFVDTFSHEDCSLGEYDDLKEAVKIAKSKAGVMSKTYVYDRQGKEVSGGFGKF